MIVEIKDRSYIMPASWNELSVKQLLAAMKVLHKDTPEDVLRLSLLKILSGMSWWRMFFCGGENLSDRLYLVDFLLKENKLTRNILSLYRGFYGPGDDFNNLLLNEFAYSDFKYAEIKKAKAEELEPLLDQFVASLYRPASKGYDHLRNPQGDHREPFNEHLIDYYAKKKIHKWPIAVKMAVVHWYEACTIKMTEDFPAIFKTGDGDDSNEGLYPIIRSVAQKGIHGDINQVERMYIKVFLMELTQMIMDASKFKSPSNSTNTDGDGFPAI